MIKWLSLVLLAPIRFEKGWKKPNRGLYKFNKDAGLISDEGFCMGGVIKDENGAFIMGFTRREKGKCSLDKAESRAMMVGIEEAKKRGIWSIVVESDSLGIIKNIKEQDEDRTEIGSGRDVGYRGG
ncbi:unnamed protein product [Linum trigynum]|uniref:RNase H type-1 domain-containing protein n=1 Tax=Linum trigynum TaxID=586398 RepID=A0AAV2DCF3_9ROSI